LDSVHFLACFDTQQEVTLGILFQTVQSTYRLLFEVRHPRCVSNKSNYKVYAYIVKHNYVLGGMLFTIRKTQLHISGINVGHLKVVQ